mgnify:CR=1 FL=1
MGIKDPDQLMRYAEGSGDVSHTFAITIKGRYYYKSSIQTLNQKLVVNYTVSELVNAILQLDQQSDHHEVTDGAVGRYN